MNFENKEFSGAAGQPGGASAVGTWIGRRRLLDRFLIQLPLVLAVTLAVQLLASLALYDHPFDNPHVLGTIAATMATNTISILIYREFRRTPGTRRFAYIVPSFLLPILILGVLIMGLRLPYTNWLLSLGLGGGFLCVWAINALHISTDAVRLYLVPTTHTPNLPSDLRGFSIRTLSEPADLEECHDGTVVVDLRDDLASGWERGIAHAVINGIPVYHLKQVQESLTGRVQIETMSENSFGSLVPSLSYLLLKRFFDVVGSVLALLILALPMCGLALLIRMTSEGPAIYRHRRVGYRGKIFETMKFRTMRSGPQDDEDLEQQKTTKSDPRVTSVGKFLRKTRLDELPQLVNVLRGEMSLIGPRPEALALSRWYDEHLDFYQYRHIVRPGISGWAQVNQGHVTELDDVYIKLQYDFYYIKNLSGWLDLLIALRTIVVMISFRGAH